MDVVDVVGQVISMAPVPYLQPLFVTFQMITSRIGQAKANKRQLQSMAHTVAQILLALNSQAVSMDNAPLGKWEDKWMRQNLYDFELLLARIAEFCIRTTKKKFVPSFLDASADQDEINSIHTQLNLSVDAFQISSQVSIQNSNKRVEVARQEDRAEINAALKQLLEKQDTLLELVGHSDSEILPQYSSRDSQSAERVRPGTKKTIFGLLNDIQSSVTDVSASPDRDETLQEVLMELQKDSTELIHPPPIDPNPVIAQLKPGLTPDVLIGPLKWQMNAYMRKEALTQHLYPQQCAQFTSGPNGSKLLVEYLVKTDDAAVQYAALDLFQQDPTLKLFFAQ